MSRNKELSNEELEYRKKLKQMAQSGIDMTERDYVPSNNFADWYADSLSAMAQLCIAANLVSLTESVERLTEEIVKSNDHRLDDIDNETKEDDYEDNMFLLDDDN